MALGGFGAVGFAAVGGAEISLPPTGFTELPTGLFPGYVWDGTYLQIPLTALDDHGLTAALANATTGDVRAIADSLVARIEEWYTDLDSADRPQAFFVQPRAGIVPYTGVFAGKEKYSLAVTTYRDRPEGTVTAEPS